MRKVAMLKMKKPTLSEKEWQPPCLIMIRKKTMSLHLARALPLKFWRFLMTDGAPRVMQMERLVLFLEIM